QTETDASRGRRQEAADRGDVAHRQLGGGCPAARESVDRPTALARLTLEAPRRIGGPRVADHVEQLDVLAAVRIREAPGQIDALLGGELLDRPPPPEPPPVPAGRGG